MTLEKLESMIDKAISDAVVRPHAHEVTNALNAEYALGKIFALFDVIEDIYGIDELIKLEYRLTDTIKALTDRTQILY